MWDALMAVVEDVRDGKRPEYQEAVKTNPELYDMVERRVKDLLTQLDRTAQNKQASS